MYFFYLVSSLYDFKFIQLNITKCYKRHNQLINLPPSIARHKKSLIFLVYRSLGYLRSMTIIRSTTKQLAFLNRHTRQVRAVGYFVLRCISDHFTSRWYFWFNVPMSTRWMDVTWEVHEEQIRKRKKLRMTKCLLFFKQNIFIRSRLKYQWASMENFFGGTFLRSL